MIAFAVAYIAALTLILAPKGSFGAGHPEPFVLANVSP